MKFILSMLISVSSLSVYSQSDDPMLDALKKNKSGTIEKAETGDKEKKSVEVTVEQTQPCDKPSQSIPYAFLSALLIDSNDLSVQHNPRTMVMSVKTGKMIANCNDMIEWKVVESQIGTETVYGVKAAIRGCESKNDGKCAYKVFTKKSGTEAVSSNDSFDPSFSGFKECLKKTGVFSADNLLVPESRHKDSASFNKKLSESGRVMFVSHGLAASSYSPVHATSYEKRDGCDYFEDIVADGKKIKTQEDEDKDLALKNEEELNSKVKKVGDKCTAADYVSISESMEKFDGLSDDMMKIRSELIKTAAKSVAKSMNDAKYEATEADLKVLADFDKYVVQAKVREAKDLYEEVSDSEGSAREAAKKSLGLVLSDIKALNGSPYFTKAHVDRLVSNGKFEDAKLMNTMKLTLQNHQNLGSKQNGVVITPEIAKARTDSSVLNFDAELEVEKEKFAYKTGEESGLAEYYSDLSTQMRENITTRTKNYTEEIQSEYARTQQGGYCFRYFRNTNKCIQESMVRIQELQAELAHYNNVDAERAGEYDEKYKEYDALEAQGRTYIAESGQEATATTTSTKDREVASDTKTAPNKNSNSYSFDFNQGAQNNQVNYQQQAQQQQYAPANSYWNNNMFQQQQNPWGNNGYQQPWMGQQSYNYNLNGNYGMQNGMYQQNGGGGGYNFNWGGGQQQYGQQQYGQQYGQQNQFYGNQFGNNQYSMYR